MEIKTLSEFRDRHVTVRVQESAVFTDNRVQIVVSVPAGTAYDPDAAAEVLAQNYRRARQEIDRLEKELAEVKSRAQGAVSRRDEALQQLVKQSEELAEWRREADRIAREANARERRQAEEIGRRFTADQVEDAKADARAEARASEGARIRSEIRAIVSPETGLARADAGDLYEVICQVRELLNN